MHTKILKHRKNFVLLKTGTKVNVISDYAFDELLTVIVLEGPHKGEKLYMLGACLIASDNE